MRTNSNVVERIPDLRWRAGLWKNILPDLAGHQAHKDRQALLDQLDEINNPGLGHRLVLDDKGKGKQFAKVEQPERNWRFEFRGESTTLVMPQLSWSQAWRLSQLFAKMPGDGHVYLYQRDGDDSLCSVCGDEAASINSHSDDFGHTLSLCDIHSDLF